VSSSEGEADEFEAIPRDLRWYVITLHNRGRTRMGTGSIYRFKAILQAARHRHPDLHFSRITDRGPLILRQHIAGPVVAVIEAIGLPH
jgi:hypothetical protein